MVRYCQSCGRSAPNDAVVCPYCGIHIDYSKSRIIPEPKQKKDDKIILIIAIVIILIVVITIAIAATVYVYVSGMVEPERELLMEDASVSVNAVDKQIWVTLAKQGQNYYNGYLHFKIYINDELVDDLSDIGYWTIGEVIIIGESSTGYEVLGSPLSSGEYDVKVTIFDTTVYDGDVDI
jgi:hypothetical protein